MELLQRYLDQIEPPREVQAPFRSPSRIISWEPFLSAPGPLITVLADRRTGKTTAAVERAIMSPHNTMLVCAAWPAVRNMSDIVAEQLDRLNLEASIRRTQDAEVWFYIPAADKCIRITSIRYCALFGFRLYDEVIFDDADCYDDQLPVDDILRAGYNNNFVVISSIERFSSRYARRPRENFLRIAAHANQDFEMILDNMQLAL